MISSMPGNYTISTTDPHEMKNLYGQPGYESITADLTKRLRALQQQYKDTIGMVK
jgi:hypothetical protein